MEWLESSQSCVTTRSGTQGPTMTSLCLTKNWQQDTSILHRAPLTQTFSSLQQRPLKRKNSCIILDYLTHSSALSIICKKNMNQAPHRAPTCPQQVEQRGHYHDMNGRCPFGDKCNFAHS